MAKNNHLGWYSARGYYKIPNRKKSLLTKEVLETFKEELINVYKKNDKQGGT